MRIAIVYDCMFPHTVGGAERWYVHLANQLTDEHEVSYLTLRQWPRGKNPSEPYEVIEVGPRLDLYTAAGRRRVWPPIRFGAGVFWHFLRHGGNYDIVHGASFPYFSVVGAKLALMFHRRTKLVIDWHEIWTKDYWIDYLGPIGGRIGFALQSLCIHLPDHNFTESKMHAKRLSSAPLTRLTGLFTEPESRPDEPLAAAAPPHVVFAGRLIPEKNAMALPAALLEARRAVPDLRATLFGHGPQFDELRALVAQLEAESFVAVPGFVESEVLEHAIATASCVVLPSRREGYGMVVLEAVCQGTPAVVLAGPDNAATELIDDGENGFVAEGIEPETIGNAIASAVRGGPDLRQSTWAWYESRRKQLSIADSVTKIKSIYGELVER